MAATQVSTEHVKIAELSRKIGQILVERGDYEQAMHQFQLGLTYLEGTEHNEVARIYNEIGRVYWHQGKLEEAQKWTEKAFELAEHLLDPEEVARLLYFAGIRYFRQGENKLAEEHWLRSLEISQETGDLPTQAKLYQNLGWQAQLMGEYKKALEYLEKGRQLASECGDISSLSYIYETQGGTYYLLGEWEKAIDNLKESLNLAEQAGLRRATSRVFSVMGDIYRHQGNWTEADECYQRSLASITGMGNPQSLAVVNLGLALINMERKAYARAEELLQKSWAIAGKGFGFTARMAAIKAYLGELYVRMEKPNQAETEVSKAIELAQQANAKSELAHAVLVQGMIAASRKEWDRAQAQLSRSLTAFEELGDKYNQGRALYEIGMMYLNRNNTTQDYEQANHYLSQAHQIFSALGAKANLEKFPADLPVVRV
ncbi:MAG: tetratricopeptide repeat protein [Chloroflexota bacterium]